MRRLIYDKKTCSYIWKDWKPEIVTDYGPTCTKQQKNMPTKVMVNNQEVQSGNNRVALYTMPGGVDTGVRYSALYEYSGLDVTEIEANRRTLLKAKKEVEGKIKEEFDKQVEQIQEAVTANTKADSNKSTSSDS